MARVFGRDFYKLEYGMLIGKYFQEEVSGLVGKLCKRNNMGKLENMHAI